jgi:sulfite reductase (NADPH) hemoprotein beta-component
MDVVADIAAYPGSADENAAIGEISTGEMVDAVETLVGTYIAKRADAGEPFLATYRRLGPAAFKEALYGAA